MTPTPRPTTRPTRSLPEVLTRPVSGRHLVAGSLLLGITATGPLLAAGLLDHAAPATRAVAQARSVPSPVTGPVAAPLGHVVAARASRGGLRTALPVTSYALRTVPVGRTFTGLASWYGGAFQGRRTASGERFDTHALTAASRTLPFGTRLRVCRSSRCVVVRVNDRGPFVASRVLDLSAAARSALGFGGVAQVTATPIGTRRVALHPVHRTAPALPTVRRTAVEPEATELPSLALVSASSAPAPDGSVAGLGLGLVAATGVGLAVVRHRRS